VRSLNRAIEYIEDNLLEELTCGAIARAAYLSSAHFQRAFNLLTGMTVGEYIRSRRLTLAGHELAAPGAKVIDVALKYGYETPESFSKAFTRFHGATPMQAKKGGVTLKSFHRLTIKMIMEGGGIMDYRIEQMDAFEVVVKAKMFTAEFSTPEVPAFWGEYFDAGLAKVVPPALGVCGEDVPGGSQFRYGIGCRREQVGAVPDGFEVWAIPAGTWAVFTCVGAMPAAIQNQWKRIYAEWLPQAEYQMIPGYDFEYYPEGDLDLPDYVSEICIRVKEK